jgi:hypothetical protein
MRRHWCRTSGVVSRNPRNFQTAKKSPGFPVNPRQDGIQINRVPFIPESIVSKEMELNANQLYRTLSPQGNPELRSLFAVLKALGLRLAIQPAQSHVVV